MMLSNRLLAAVAALSVSAAACSKSGSEPSEAKQPPAAEPTAAANPTEPAPAAEPADEPAAPTDAMSHYETLRVALVNDDTGPVAATASQLAQAAEAAGNAELAAAAKELAAAPADDIEKVRLAFGEVSKHVVAMLEANPEMAGEHHVFECPMAKGYKRWVQPGEAVENPYMGQKMLACGSEVAGKQE